MTLYNFATFLGRIAGAPVHDPWMVDGWPAYSAAF
jgi:hypothetical protein